MDDDDGADPDSSIKSTDRHRGDPRWSSSSKSPSDLFQQTIQRRHDKTVRLRECGNAKNSKDDEAWYPFRDDRQAKIRETFHIFESSSVYDVKEDVREDERVEADDMPIATKSRQQSIRSCSETDRSCPEHKRCENKQRSGKGKQMR